MSFTPPSHTPLWLGRPAPRYTSYPPATQFTAAEPDSGAAVAATFDLNAPISLYLHIPFCRELCLFCGCHQVITQRAERISAYLEALQAEIKLRAASFPQRLKVAHLHFGGGSPSTLTPAQFHTIMDLLEANFTFLPDAERAMELDPRTTAPELVEALVARGINRASLGVQDFDPAVQQLIHRIQPFEMVANVMATLRAAGLKALSLDLMYGLPGQSVESVTNTAKAALTLAPKRFSLFSYAHVPTMKPYQKKLEEAGLPSDMDKLAQEHAMREVLTAGGYVSVGIDHFALPDDPLAKLAGEGQLGRNFQGYTDDPAQQMLGLGASSISETASAYVQNEPDLPTYQRRVLAGEIPARRVCWRSADDQRRAALISELMCNLAVDLAAFRTPTDDLSDCVAKLGELQKGGLVKIEGDKLTVDPTCRMAVRVVAAAFDAYYDASKLSSKVA